MKNEIYTDYLVKQFSSDKRLFSRRKAYIKANYQAVIPANKAAQILEIGPGFGEAIDLLVNDMGYLNAKAVDISRGVVEACNHVVESSTEYIDDLFSFLENNKESFDCIMMFHVLEHIPKHETVMLIRKLHGALAPGGKLLIEVPNMANPITSTIKRYGDFTHEIGYTSMSLSYVLTSGGFSSLKILGSKLPKNGVLELAQSVVQTLLNMVVLLLVKAYMPSNPVILDSAIIAVAKK
jgi:2-polyprenyl-3-methyl-5-hydroxy-6-metoxy-1,4-benzoquinol methylase